MSRYGRDRGLATTPSGGDEERPDLAAVLEHYGAEVNPYRTSQMIRCIFHEDGTPSLSVNVEKQLFKCHSCGQGGDVWTLIMLREEVDFDGAKALAAAEQFPAGDVGGSGGDVRSRGNRRGSKVAARPRNRRGDRDYVPSWRSNRPASRV